ncbi:MAG: S-adenosylmethionine:tRNA ribosyltransferase-isomerase [Dehalococcoidia bacterium]|nr:S-adenosylmethionine:tRNA ribosyltransferase-isomerase [Dehalococcoidia bacterium]
MRQRPRRRLPTSRRACSRPCDERGVETVGVFLDVGPGTFQPVKAEDPREHRMHAEIRRRG